MFVQFQRALFRPIVRLALIVGLVLPIARPAQALASPSGPTLVITLRAFPTGTPIPHTLAGTVQLAPGAQVSLTAPAQVFGPGNPQPAYGFGFWNITTDVRTTQTVTYSAPTDTSTIQATAWYWPLGGSTCPTCLPAVSTYAFSLNYDQVLPSMTPIASVTPPGAWKGGNSTGVATTTSASPVAITAKSLIGGYGRFQKWLNFGNGSVSNSILTVPANGSSQAIAFYGIPVPDPCEPTRHQLDTLSPGDFLTLQAYRAAYKQLSQQLVSCEWTYGEI